LLEQRRFLQMPKAKLPPTIIDSAWLREYAVVDRAVVHNKKSALLVDGKPLGRVPCLAICQAFDSAEVFLLFCDKRWESRGVAGCSSVAEARKRAEREYPGISKKWVRSKVTKAQATRLMRQQLLDQSCSFCGKPPYEVGRLFSAPAARICDQCVQAFSVEIGKAKQ
jgi:hypothetical protein